MRARTRQCLSTPWQKTFKTGLKIPSRKHRLPYLCGRSPASLVLPTLRPRIYKPRSRPCPCGCCFARAGPGRRIKNAFGIQHRQKVGCAVFVLFAGQGGRDHSSPTPTRARKIAARPLAVAKINQRVFETTRAWSAPCVHRRPAPPWARAFAAWMRARTWPRSSAAQVMLGPKDQVSEPDLPRPEKEDASSPSRCSLRR